MKKLIYLFIMIVLSFLKTSAQTAATKAPEYKVPSAYHFDYKVVYEVDRNEKKAPETMSYYFTNNGDYMSIESQEMEKEKDMNFMISTKDGLMITFGEEAVPKNPDKNRKVLKVMDMHSMMKGSGEAITALAKNMPKKDKPEAEKKKPNDLDNFVKTGRTKQAFGYTAEEYSKHFTKDENGKERSGTMSVWYAKVDFDPEMMFSMGMGTMAGGGAQSRMNQTHSNNMLGLGLTQKNYLLIEMDAAETGGKSGTAMKVVSIEKTNFNKSTEGYFIKNYSGMSMKEMMQKESEEK
ncbi:MAG TPA: hypothetical protein VF346_00285 [Bacteroidales bacterium]